MNQRPSLPDRVVNVRRARQQFGDFPDRFLPALWRSDDLADAVADDFAALGKGVGRAMLDRALTEGIDAVEDPPESLRALFSQLDHVPAWVDWEAMRRAAKVFFRTSMAGGLVLGAKSLLSGYCSPAGNKPLIMSGQLRNDDRIGYRLAETGRFVVEVSREEGMRRFSEGFAITVRVRMMHAMVRRLIRQTGTYRPELWGEPINQHDMVATTILFSLAFLDGVRQFGFVIDEDEEQDFLSLWRYNGYVIGVEPELLPATAREGRRIADVITVTQRPPDEDSRALVKAMVEAPLRIAGDDPRAQREAKTRVAIGYGFARYLLGDEMADHLQLPKTPARFVTPAVRRVVARAERLARGTARYENLARRAGEAYWERAITLGLQGKPAFFRMPERLGGKSKIHPDGRGAALR